jgi:hypothetical protein
MQQQTEGRSSNLLTVQDKAARIANSDYRSRRHRSHHGCWWPRLRWSILNTVRARTIVLVQSPRVRSAIQVSVAVTALLLALVVGPDVHVHQGEGPNRETVVHIHLGIAGHVHRGTPSGSGLSGRDGTGPAVYLNAYSSIATHATALPILIPQPLLLVIPASTTEAAFVEPPLIAHSPPLIDYTCPRPPPLVLST